LKASSADARAFEAIEHASAPELQAILIERNKDVSTTLVFKLANGAPEGWVELDAKACGALWAAIGQCPWLEDRSDSFHLTLLHAAVLLRAKNLVRMLLGFNAPVDIVALFCAGFADDTAAAQLFIERIWKPALPMAFEMAALGGILAWRPEFLDWALDHGVGEGAEPRLLQAALASSNVAAVAELLARTQAIEQCVKNDVREVNIPDGVRHVGQDAFGNCQQLTEVRLPDSLEHIGNWAFCQTGLRSVTIPNVVKEMGGGAFESCRQLTEVRLSDSLEWVPCSAFRDTCLERVEIPSGVKEIEMTAFLDCHQLTEVRLPASLDVIGISAFWGTGLKSVRLPKGTILEESAFPPDVVLERF
jgi:hypothetical protein